MPIHIAMMFKNEVDLLPIWVGYHGKNFGFNNITIIDNGSDREEIFPIIDHAEKIGVNVVRGLSSNEDFINKGDIIMDIFLRLKKLGDYKFFVPLDCDEFIGVFDEGNFYFNFDKVYSSLNKYIEDSRVLRILAGYDNNPLLPGYFRPSPEQKKCFFSNGDFNFLDHGFHEAQTASGGDSIKTPLIYMHYHFKPYELLIEHSKQKLRPFIKGLDDIDIGQLPNTVAGVHLLTHLRLSGIEQYHSTFNYKDYIRIPEFGRALDRIGYRLPFSSIDFGPEGFDPIAYLRKNPDVASAGVDPVYHYMKFGRNEGRVLY